MSTSTKPYIGRALWEWCCDNSYTPLLLVRVDAYTRVPMQYVKEGQIILNISPQATRGLQMSNEVIQFNARFGGVSQEVSVPWSAVMGLYAKETEEGMLFEMHPTEEEAGETQSEVIAESLSQVEEGLKTDKKPRPTLTIVK